MFALLEVWKRWFQTHTVHHQTCPIIGAGHALAHAVHLPLPISAVHGEWPGSVGHAEW